MIRETHGIEFTDWVRKRCKEKHVKHYQLAREVYVNPNTLSGYLNEYNRMPIDIAERIVQVLGAEMVIKEIDNAQ